MRNEKGNMTLAMLLLIVAVLTVGTMMTLMTQEVIASKDFNTVINTKYIGESINEKAIFDTIKIIEEKQFDAVTWNNQDNYIFTSDDVNTVVSGTTSGAFLSTIQAGTHKASLSLDLYNGDCSTPLHKVYDPVDPISICGKMQIGIDNSNTVATFRLDNIHLVLVDAVYDTETHQLLSGRYIVSSRDKVKIEQIGFR